MCHLLNFIVIFQMKQILLFLKMVHVPKLSTWEIAGSKG